MHVIEFQNRCLHIFIVKQSDRPHSATDIDKPHGGSDQEDNPIAARANESIRDEYNVDLDVRALEADIQGKSRVLRSSVWERRECLQ